MELLKRFDYKVARQCAMPGEWAAESDGPDGVNPRPRLAGARPKADVVAWRRLGSRCEILVVETEWTKAAAYESVAQAYEYAVRLKRHGVVQGTRRPPGLPGSTTVRAANVVPLVVGNSWRKTEVARALNVKVMGLPAFIRYLLADSSKDRKARRRSGVRPTK
ncbi:MAG: hypothetical protein WCO96_02265 [Actinomycetes bacterium]